MNRRDFLKNTLALAAFAPLLKLHGAAPAKKSPSQVWNKLPRTRARQILRRDLGKNGVTLPLLGYGMMRLPVKDGSINMEETARLVERAMNSGINYFDTAYFYHGGESETACGKVLSKYPRDTYYIASKMPIRSLRKEADLERIFNEQLKKCACGYFDFYLLHNLTRRNWPLVKRLKVYDFVKKKQKEGLIRFVGFSFHDTPDVLQEIASAYQWDFAQIQLNYLDWTLYKSKEQYEILAKAKIPVIVMEPLRGGALASLSPAADAVLKKSAPGKSVASWAFRFAGSCTNVVTVLSGMTKMEHLEDNISTMMTFQPLSEKERATLNSALEIYRKAGAIACSGCEYCMPCPVGVEIPRIFSLYNHAKTSGRSWSFKGIYRSMSKDTLASACINCQACIKKCPQKLNIPEELKKAHAFLKSR